MVLAVSSSSGGRLTMAASLLIATLVLAFTLGNFVLSSEADIMCV